MSENYAVLAKFPCDNFVKSSSPSPLEEKTDISHRKHIKKSKETAFQIFEFTEKKKKRWFVAHLIPKFNKI